MRNTHFELNRFWHLVRNDLFANYRSLLVAGGASIGLLLVINFFSMLGGEVLVLPVFYCLMLFIGGYIITSLAFNDLHDPQRSYVYLTLPASNVEKLFSKLLLTTIGYILAALVLYFLFSLVMSLMNLVVFGESYPLFNPFDEVVWICNGIYFVTQSVFLLGAVVFRKNSLIKTLLTLWLISSVIGIFSGIVFRVTFHEFFNGWFFFSENVSVPTIDLDQRLTDFFTGFGRLMVFSFKWVMAPVVWFITYLYLKEAEV